MRKVMRNGGVTLMTPMKVVMKNGDVLTMRKEKKRMKGSATNCLGEWGCLGDNVETKVEELVPEFVSTEV